MNTIEQMIQTLCPDGVKRVRLGEVGSFYSGLSGKSKKDFEDGNAKFITYKNVYSNPALKIDVEDTVKIAPDEKQNTIKYGDILFTGSSETPDECAFSSVLNIHTDEKLYLNSFCFGYRFNDLNQIDIDFYKHYFRCLNMRKRIAKTANGTTRFNVSKKDFAQLEIPLPPLPIQAEIVKILDRFAVLTAELEAELEGRRKQYEYYRTRLLSFDSSSDTNAVRWMRLGEVCKFQNGFSFQSSKFSKTGLPILRITNIQNSNIDESSLVYFNPMDYKDKLDQYKVYPHRIVVAMSGATTGKVGMNHSEVTYYLNQRVGMFVPNEEILNNAFLFHYLQSKEENLYYMAGGGAQPNLSSKAVNEMLIPIPSLSEQERIVNILDKFDQLVNGVKDSIPALIDDVQKQYEFYRNKLLTFPE